MIETGIIVGLIVPIYVLLLRIEHRLTALECREYPPTHDDTSP